VSNPYELPMFPLGAILFPYNVLPLRVFEPRYRVLAHDVLEGNKEFGVVLIERGFEVGGGDERFGLGTVARIVQAAQTEDGRWGLLTVGSRRIKVQSWLPDDPYPKATVVDLPDDKVDESHTERLQRVERSVRRALGLKAELAEPTMAPATFELAEDPDVACWQLAAYAPLEQIDHLRVLGVDDPAERLDVLAELTEEAASMLELRLTSG
jgi:Lon protease-like protein